MNQKLNYLVSVERRSRRNGDGGTESDRRAITSSIIPQITQRINDQEFSLLIEENEISPTSNDGVNKHRMSSKTIPNSPGEITQF